MAGGDIISLENVSVSFNGAPVLEDITFRVGAEDFVAIIGPNGSGKTTILKVVVGLIRPTSGTVRVFGSPPKEGRKLVGYLPQHTAFDPDFPMSVMEVVLMGRYKGVFRRYTEADRAAAVEALRVVGMDAFRDRQVGRLSGGQKQRVFIARAIAKEPRLLLLDEPTSSIDPEMQKSLYDLLSELKKRMAIVMVTHDTGVVTDLVDTIACVNRKLFYHGPPEEGLQDMDGLYQCPVELVSHGVPHRVLKKHGKQGDGRK